MKSLILALSLLFLTGTHGRAFLQSDEPKPATDDVVEAITGVAENAIKFGSEVVQTLESDFAKPINVNEKREALKANIAHFHHQLEKNAATIREQVEKELQEKYPVFKEKALPIIKESLLRLEEHGRGKKNVRPSSDLKKDFLRSFAHLQPLVEGFLDKLRSEAEILQSNLSSYETELREKYKKKSD